MEKEHDEEPVISPSCSSTIMTVLSLVVCKTVALSIIKYLL